MSAHGTRPGSGRPTLAGGIGREARLLTPAVLAGAAVIGALGARKPAVFLAAAALMLVVAVCVAAYRHPTRTLAVGFFLLPVAETKFRMRSPGASVAGEVDAQVVMELGIYALIALIAVVTVASSAFRWRPLTRPELLLGAYVAMAVGSELWSQTPVLTAVRGMQLVILFVLATVCARTLGPERTLDGLARAVVPYVLVCALMAAVLPWAEGRASDGAPVARFSWFYVHPIAAATFTGLGILRVVMDARRELARRASAAAALRAAVLVTPLLAVLVLTRARGPALATFGALVVLAIRGRAPRWVVTAASAGALALVAVYVNAGFSFVRWLDANRDVALIRFILREQTAGDIAEFSGRDELWRAASDLFAARPAIGYGYGGARTVLLEALPWAGDAHNGFVQTVLDVGMLGTVPLLVAFGLALCSAVGAPRPQPLAHPRTRAPDTQAATLAYFVFALAIAATDVCFAQPGVLFLLVASCVAAAGRLRGVVESEPPLHRARLALAFTPQERRNAWPT